MRRLKNIRVSWVSLVDKGANQKHIVCKCEREDLDKASLVSTDFIKIQKNNHKKIVYGIVYAPEQVDAHGDIADAETIEKASQEFMRQLNLHNIDKQHNFEDQKAFVVENWIVRKGDELFPDELGAWAMGIKVEDDVLWQECLDGNITGLSLYGEAITEDYNLEGVSSSEQGILTKIYEMLKKWLGGTIPTPLSEGGLRGEFPLIDDGKPETQNKGDNQMEEKTKQEITELVKSEISTAVNESLKLFKEEIETKLANLEEMQTALQAEITKSNSNPQDTEPEEISFI